METPIIAIVGGLILLISLPRRQFDLMSLVLFLVGLSAFFYAAVSLADSTLTITLPL